MDALLCRDHLKRLLAEQANTLARLESLLDQEYDLLRANDFDGFERVGAERQNCTGELIRIEDERRSMCRMLDVSPDANGLNKLMQWCDPNRSLKSQWELCADRASRCRDRNERNGALVRARLQRVESLLDVITGRSQHNKLYGPQGAYQSSAPAHVLAKV